MGGIGRYPSDLFVGGNPWSLSALWIGLYYAAAGQKEQARHYLDWCLRHAACHDFLPEQSDKRTGEPASAVPLGWSHAWAVVLLRMLGTKAAGRTGATDRDSADRKVDAARSSGLPTGASARSSGLPTGASADRKVGAADPADRKGSVADDSADRKVGGADGTLAAASPPG